MKIAIQFLLGVCLLLVVNAGAARFDGSKVYRISIQDSEQLKQFRAFSADEQVQALDNIGRIGRDYDIVVKRGFCAHFEKFLSELKIKYQTVIENLQNAIENAVSSPMEWTQWHSLDDIYSWLNRVILKHFPYVTPFTIGYSYEGRPIRGIRVSYRPGNKAIVIDSSIHAIEWISSATSTCFFNKLLNSNSDNMKYLRENYDWYLTPVVNPDGFVYSHDVQRLWRKNVKPTGYSNETGPCLGTDLNRNFDYMFKVAGYNIDVPCDHWYGGNSPASEPEVQAVQKFLLSLPQGYARIYLAMHSYGNFLLLPYGHTDDELPPNYEQMKTISKGFADAAKVKYGTNFLYGPSGQLNYPVSGSAKDYAYAVANIPYTATLELRDNGTYGFFLPTSQIIEVCEEITDGILGMIPAAEAEGLFD